MPIAKEQFVLVGQAILGGAVNPPEPYGESPTGTVVLDPPLVFDSQIGLVRQPVAGATEYAVLWSTVLEDSSIFVSTTWATIDTDTSVDHWISLYPCNASGCGNPTQLGPIKKD
jgi:hypothetical protein